MEKTSTIKSCDFNKEWVGERGTFYYHTITFENGDTGQIGTKEKNPAKLNPGTEMTYTLEVGERGNKIKAVNKPFGAPKFTKEPFEEKMAGMAMSYAVQLIVGGKVEVGQLGATFNKIHDLLMTKKV